MPVCLTPCALSPSAAACQGAAAGCHFIAAGSGLPLLRSSTASRRTPRHLAPPHVMAAGSGLPLLRSSTASRLRSHPRLPPHVSSQGAAAGCYFIAAGSGLPLLRPYTTSRCASSPYTSSPRAAACLQGRRFGSAAAAPLHGLALCLVASRRTPHRFPHGSFSWWFKV